MTDGCQLQEANLPKKTFKLRFYAAVGEDNDPVIRWCGGDELDGFGTSRVSDGSHARLKAVQIGTDNKRRQETESYWSFHYGKATSANDSAYAHKHDISRTVNGSTTSSAGEINSTGNLPPYLVCYIWQRTE